MKPLPDSFICTNPRCRQDADITYMGRNLCETHYIDEETIRQAEAYKRLNIGGNNNVGN